MEELERKLNSNNPIIVSQTISNLLKSIRDKKQAGNANSKLAELVYLKELYLQSDPLICEVSCEAILKLVEEKVLDGSELVTEVLVAVPAAKCLSKLVNLLSSLLYLELEESLKGKSSFESQYNLHGPRHPFVVLLSQPGDVALNIYSEIELLVCFNDSKCGRFGFEFFKPVFLYVLTQNDSKLQWLKFKLWKLLLACQPQSLDLLEHCLHWINLKHYEGLEVSSHLVEDLLEQFGHEEELFLLYQMTILHHLTFRKIDCRLIIKQLTKICQGKNLITINMVLLILGNILRTCAHSQLKDVLIFCTTLFEDNTISNLSLNVIKAALLQWIANANNLTEDCIPIASQLFLQNPAKEDDFKSIALQKFILQNQTAILINTQLFATSKLCLVEDELEFLTKIQEFPLNFLHDFLPFLYGCFLQTSNADFVKQCYEIILRCIREKNDLSNEFLVLVLYKLSNCSNSVLHFTLLELLPQLTLSNDNLNKVVFTIQALNQKDNTVLGNFACLLMLKAWKTNQKCYVHLEKMLSSSVNMNSLFKVEFCTTKAFILRELCERRPELHGKDLVPHLSKMLNSCKSFDLQLPCCLAIEAITFLCKSSIIDIITTWTSLEPMIKSEVRPLVLVSFCKLLQEVPNLPYYEACSEDQINNFVQILWSWADPKYDQSVVKAALTGLTGYNIEQITSQIPDCFLDEESLSLKKNNSLVNLPKSTWIGLFDKLGNYAIVGDFFRKLISLEISSYRNYIYNVNQSKEPFKFDYLPQNSMVRCIGEYLRKTPSNRQIYLECLKVFSIKFAKPLPPVNWTFLSNIFQDPLMQGFCIDLAAQQVVVSQTARKFIEGVLNMQDLNEDLIVTIFKNLNYLANSIQPMILQPFIHKNLPEDKPQLLEKLLFFCRATLKSHEVENTNKLPLAQLISQKIFHSNQSLQELQLFLECLPDFPAEFFTQEIIKDFTLEPLSNEDVTIQCLLAEKSQEQPLTWLSKIINSENLIRRKDFVLKNLQRVFQRQNCCDNKASWIVDLMGLIQNKIAQETTRSYLEYLLDIFTLAVVVFAGFQGFVKELNTGFCRELFPQAFGVLIERPGWENCKRQALQWLYFMNVTEIVPVCYRNMFGCSLITLRHTSEFIFHAERLKFMNCSIDLK